ncbi:MAG: hypothetical protein AB7K24_27835, partial [Gemmataceae bacterium]
MKTSQGRRGVVLIVVLALLTLFAVVGVTFVLYAQLQADQARIFREAQTKRLSAGPAASPELLLAEFLRQLIYDLPDDNVGAKSALRGHSLARTMYGAQGPFPNNNNIRAFNGVGRIRFNITGGVFAGRQNYDLINYTYFDNSYTLGNERRDPEYPYGSANYVGINGSYTYPDNTNVFLAAVNANGDVLVPSYHRPAVFNPSSGLNDQTNPNWTNDVGKYMILRPRPVDMSANFPYPTDLKGDVKNLVGAPGGNDSVWLNLGAPVMTLPDGRKVVPLFAPLVTDLDNRININIAGNLVGNPTHGSNQGWGPWEVNPGKVLKQGGAEWQTILLGNGTIAGRYGPDAKPGTNGTQASPGTSPRFYGQVDFDSWDEIGGGGNSQAFQMPSTSTFSSFPTYPSSPGGWGNGSNAERTNHPLLYNIFDPKGGTSLNNDDKVFDDSNMMALLRDTSTTNDVKTSELGQLCPTNFDNLVADPTGRIRRLVTTRSFDVDQPGLTPHILTPTSQPYALASLFPTGNAAPFPSTYQAPAGTFTEFGADWRYNGGFFDTANTVQRPTTRLDLNQSLPDYPAPDATGLITDMAGFTSAQNARQEMAKQIFLRLRAVTGASDPDPSASAPANEVNALRYLAQLAVNIVDFIDNDNYMTPFQWEPTNNEYVFGTELPRLVINEVYTEIQNDKADMGQMMANNDYQVRFWVELHNPMNNPTAMDSSDDGTARLYVGAAGSGHAAYKLVVTESTGIA